MIVKPELTPEELAQHQAANAAPQQQSPDALQVLGEVADIALEVLGDVATGTGDVLCSIGGGAVDVAGCILGAIFD